MTKNIKSNLVPVGVPVMIAGQEYRLSLTMLGLDYLDEKFGAGEAMKKFQEMGQKLQTGDIDRESRDVMVEWIYASLVHNQFDNQGVKVREIPSVFQIRSSLAVGEILSMSAAVLASYRTSFPAPKEDAGDPQ